MIRLEEREFAYLVEYVRVNYGLNLKKKKVLIECRLKSELEKYHLSSFGEYLAAVERDSTGTMAADMITRLTTHYSYFMRESQHFELLRDVILPEISMLTIPSVYAVWCAGCSTGQECYTLGMFLEEYRSTGKWMPMVIVQATDISETVLIEAQKARYQSKELERIPDRWIRKYCNINPDQSFEIKESLRSSIRYRKQNLKTYVQEKEQYDLILCRNVMIYFDAASKKKLIQELEKSLKPGGYLFVGHSELLTKDDTSLKYVGAAAYRKEKK